MLSGPPRLVPFVVIFFVLALGWWYLHIAPASGSSLPTWNSGTSKPHAAPASLRGDPLDFGLPLRFTDGQAKPPGSNYTYKIVIPKTEKEDIGWMAEEIPEAPLVIYEVDKSDAENKIPKNKGREAMVCKTAVTRSSQANRGARCTFPTSSTITTILPIRRFSCTPIAMRGTTTCSWASTPYNC